MVILCLGSNLGDRLRHLRAAYQALRALPEFSIEAVSPVYISDALLPEDGPLSWDMPYLNVGLRCKTRLDPYDLLNQLKDIEVKLGRKPDKDWAPRPVDIDILAWDDLVQYDEKLHIPHEHLHTRPFALWPLADVAPFWVYPLKNEFAGKRAIEIAEQWGSRFNGEAPLRTRQIPQRIDTPEIVGILNITPDSFSDGGLFFDAGCAVEQAGDLILGGAEIIDIGAEASNPQAVAITEVEEWSRLAPVLEAVLAAKDNYLIPPKISVDTRRPSVAKKALALGVDWINDVSGLENPEMREILLDQHCDIVFMHQLGIPARANCILPLGDDVVDTVYRWAERNLEEFVRLGFQRERLILDVGIGFGKNAVQCVELLRNISRFKDLGVRMLVGHSRKVFLKLFTDAGAEERDIETLAVSLMLAECNVDYLRVHNPSVVSRALKVTRSLA